METFDDLEALACGQMGLNIDYLYSLTERQFFNILRGYVKKQEEAAKLQLTINRDLEFAIVAPYLKNQHLTPETYKPFPWEQKTVSTKKRLSQEDHLKIWEKVDQQKK